MTVALPVGEVANQITERFPDALIESNNTFVVVNSEALLDVVTFLKETDGLDFDYLSSITGIDYYDYFEVVYLLVSLEHNHSLALKVRCYGRENPAVPSVVSLYQGADFQEREVYDLVGINFVGHPNLKRIFLWEGFDGHPLRKDYL